MGADGYLDVRKILPVSAFEPKYKGPRNKDKCPNFQEIRNRCGWTMLADRKLGDRGNLADIRLALAAAVWSRTVCGRGSANHLPSSTSSNWPAFGNDLRVRIQVGWASDPTAR